MDIAGTAPGVARAAYCSPYRLMGKDFGEDVAKWKEFVGKQATMQPGK
jgi:hypothetical protein